MSATKHDPGFTLIEVLVALVVVALLVTVTISSALLASERESHATKERAAVIVARAAVETLASGRVGSGYFAGKSDGLSWSANARTLVEQPQKHFALVAIDVAVRDSNNSILLAATTERIMSVAS